MRRERQQSCRATLPARGAGQGAAGGRASCQFSSGGGRWQRGRWQRGRWPLLQAVALLLQLAGRLRDHLSRLCSRKCLITQCRQPSEEGTWTMKLISVVSFTWYVNKCCECLPSKSFQP